jgi:hypothetical protein
VSFTATFSGLSGFYSDVGAATSSPVVELANKLWCVRIYPGGVDRDSAGFLSCFVACESPGPTRASFRVSVLNQKGWKNHHYVSECVRLFDKMRVGDQWGDPKFIHSGNLKNPSNGICVDDKILIRVELTVYSSLEKATRSPGIALSWNLGGSPQHSLSLDGPGGNHHQHPHRPSRLVDDLAHLLQDSSLADVVIVAPTASAFALHDCCSCQYHGSGGGGRVGGGGSAPGTGAASGEQHEYQQHDNRSLWDVGTKEGGVAPDICGHLDADYGASASASAGAGAGAGADAVMSIDTDEPELEHIPAHKFLLSLRSPVFRAMFQGSMSEALTNEVHISDFDAAVLKEFLAFLYTDSVSPAAMEAHAEQLLALACKYEVPGLEYLCENHLCASLCVTNVVGVLYLADMFQAQQLKARALRYIAQNAKAVVQQEGFFRSLSFALCQEVVLALAGVEPQQQQQLSMVVAASSESVYGRDRERDRDRDSDGGGLPPLPPSSSSALASYAASPSAASVASGTSISTAASSSSSSNTGAAVSRIDATPVGTAAAAIAAEAQAQAQEETETEAQAQAQAQAVVPVRPFPSVGEYR